jgi:hypothetical protein
MVKYLLVNAFIFLTFLSVAQTDNKDVIITSSGSGTSQEQAKQTALRNAIEQAFGTFISSKTEILNDEIVADQMSSVSSGNIKSYEVLNESQLPNGTWASTLRVIVSVDKLTSFVEAKGITVEIKGGLFALNIKQQLLNEQGEINAIAEMVGVLHEPMQTAFDYTIKSGDPKSLDAESKNWEIPLTVTATANKNMDFCANYFIKTLSSISLTQAEVETYKSLNKKVFTVEIKFLGVNRSIFLRKQISVDIILSFINNWEFYTRLYTIHSGIDEKNGEGKGNINHLFENSLRYNQGFKNVIIIAFPSVFQTVATFALNDKKTLTQIEQITGYSVKPRGVVSPFRYGGYLIFEKDGHGLVAAIYDCDSRWDWNGAVKAGEEFVSNGYNDWRLPTIDELNLMNNKAFLSQCYYWSNTVESENLEQLEEENNNSDSNEIVTEEQSEDENNQLKSSANEAVYMLNRCWNGEPISYFSKNRACSVRVIRSF